MSLEVRFEVRRCQDASKYVCGLRSAPDTSGGAYSAPPDPLAGFGRGEVGMEKATDGKGMDREGKKGGEKGNGNGN